MSHDHDHHHDHDHEEDNRVFTGCIVIYADKTVSKTIKEFCERWLAWNVVVVGDKSTNHEIFKELEVEVSKYPGLGENRFKYLSPDEQEERYKELSDSIGWNTYHRRNIGYVYAYDLGSCIIASVKDGFIPYKLWGEDLYLYSWFVGEYTNVSMWESSTEVFDPYSITNNKHLWHRGFPVQQVKHKNNPQYCGLREVLPKIQYSISDGAADLDSIGRVLNGQESVMFDLDNRNNFFSSYNMGPINGDNTFIDRTAIGHFASLPYVGRFGDVWGGYVAQSYHHDSILYQYPTGYMSTHTSQFASDLTEDQIGYTHTQNFVSNIQNWMSMVPEETIRFWQAYRKCFK
jgi:hypothetical protein